MIKVGQELWVGWHPRNFLFFWINLCGTNHTDLALGHSYHSVFQTFPVEEELGLLIGFFPLQRYSFFTLSS